MLLMTCLPATWHRIQVLKEKIKHYKNRCLKFCLCQLEWYNRQENYNGQKSLFSELPAQSIQLNSLSPDVTMQSD
jgi:hypothetical protein